MLQSDLELMIDAARRAGGAVMNHFRPGETVSDHTRLQDKGHDNPLTRADLEADALLKQHLLGGRPDYGWLSEESADNAVRLQHRRVWVVDPIDGTKEFIAGIPQFAVSIGLVEDGIAVAGVVYNPALDEMFSAARGLGGQCNGQPLHVSPVRALSGASCIASRSETRRGEWRPFEGEFRLAEIGSIAYKLAVLAAGRFDLTFTLTPKSEWDICAGVALVREAGGRVTDKEGHPLRFNQPRPKLQAVLASNGHLHHDLVARLASVPLSPGRKRDPAPV